jgi:hypothetical protein
MSYVYTPPSTAGNITVAGGTGTTFTLTGTSGTSATTSPYIWAGTTGWDTGGTSGTLQVKGDAVFDGNVTVKGRDLTQMLEAIESRLGILTPNPQLESEFDELKALGDAYREAEKKFKEQKQIFEILKNQDK